MLSGRQLKQLRLQQDLSQQQVANFLGVSKNYISMLETEKRSYSEDFHDKWVGTIYKIGTMTKKEQVKYIESLKESIEKIK